MGTEFELKYRADRAGLEEIRAAFPGAWAVIPMETTYYDTVSGDISCRRWTLRHRLEGETRVCTLKTPAPGGARCEWEVTGQSIGGALPELARLSGEDFLETLTEKKLTVACGARFTRMSRLLELPGCTAELALDGGVLLGGGRELEFFETELELKSGDPQALVEYAAGFAARFGLAREPLSKFARAKALAQEE